MARTIEKIKWWVRHRGDRWFLIFIVLILALCCGGYISHTIDLLRQMTVR